jgi:hypothetical protein
LPVRLTGEAGRTGKHDMKLEQLADDIDWDSVIRRRSADWAMTSKLGLSNAWGTLAVFAELC